MLKQGVISLIGLYQKTVSPDHGLFRGMYPHGVCRYQPTCSDYTKAAVERYGVVKGAKMGLKRVARCHPWAPGGFDPLPEK